jgi:hypothetical protein
VTYPQAGAVCPQCGSADQVHSIEEWAAMAQASMGRMWQPGAPMPGYPAQPTPTPGYAPGQPTPEPGYAPGQPTPPGPGAASGFPDPSQYQQSGFPDPSQYQQSGFPDPSQYQQPGSPGGAQQQPAPAQQPTQEPGYQPGPTPPGYQPGPTPQYLPGPESWQNQPPPRRRSWDTGGDASSIEEAIGDAVLGSATKAIGRIIGRKMRQAYNERIVPAMAARQEAVLNDRVAIAQRHPDLRACLKDQVVFLVGGTRVLPLASAMQVRTVEQSDALVAQLR